MAKFKGGFGVNTADAIEAGDGDIQTGYTGPLPPAGIYRATLKRMELTKTGERAKNPGTPMLKMLVEIDEPKDSSKAKYNGYGIWTNQTITEQSAPFVNQTLASMVAGDERKLKALKHWFWNGDLNTENSDGGHINAIGKFKVGSPEASIPVIINTKNKKTTPDYPDPGLEVKRWLVPSENEKSDDFAGEEDEFDTGLTDEFDSDDLGDEFE